MGMELARSIRMRALPRMATEVSVGPRIPMCRLLVQKIDATKSAGALKVAVIPKLQNFLSSVELGGDLEIIPVVVLDLLGNCLVTT